MFEHNFEHKIIDSNIPVTVTGLTKQVQAMYVWNLFNVSKKSVLVITNSLYDANLMYKNLSYITDSVMLFPMDDFLVSEAIAISPELMSNRIDVINMLSCCNKPLIIITNLMGYLRYLPGKNLWLNSKIRISNRMIFKRDGLIKNLLKIGYKKENIVTKSGEFANRGYILDVFPYGSDLPIRIEFFDDEVDSIRNFNPDDQLSLSGIDTVEICPFTEFINENGLEVPMRQSLLPRVTKDVSCISQYMDDNTEVFIDMEELKLSYLHILNEVTEFKETDNYKIDSYMHHLNNLIPNKYVNIINLNNIVNKDSLLEKYNTNEIDNFNLDPNKINEFIACKLKEGKKVIACIPDDDKINRFINVLKVKYVLTKNDEIFENVLNIVKKKLLNGFIINDIVYIGINDLFRNSSNNVYHSRFRYGSKIKDINKLSIGDYVVHSSHGIGRYMGIITLTSKGLKKDYLNLQYKNNDKLYIPVEKIELISKYSSNEGIVPVLNKLGSTEWHKKKAKIRGKVKDIANELLVMSAQRKLVKGFTFLKDDEDQLLFESKFPYIETKDQLKASLEIKKDMENQNPMDRLLCGDVGYGKTEVAFRAIFKAIKSGKQVAFLCPTTILSKQHYENALERFEGFGINIEILNRFVNEKKKKEILFDLKNGKIDFIIGTHSLLSKDIEYKDLGLLVIDEEQRFGVTHKEKIKEYKKNIDVLTLSATPIPRTLQMSLSGIRGLSLIETPPAERYPIQTYVLRENDQVIKDAIYKELSRDGQVFILFNKVAKIDDMTNKINKLVPEATVTFIHGQMSKSDIEKRMESFVNKEYNILVCTTIIETGIDIQNANTLIVIDADCFGLSQLYQIRGRIGRGKNIAYAYLMYNKNKELNEIAVKRLTAIKEFTELGSGYALAMRDLSIRGAGDVLGSEQSGFIDTVGYDMYLRMLNEEVERLKGNEIEEEKQDDEKPLLQVSTHIDDSYVDDESLKIEIHKKINTITSRKSLNKIKEELQDRFGKLDEQIIIYMHEELFEYLAKKKNVVKVEQNDKYVSLVFDSDIFKNLDGAELLSKLFKITRNFSVNYSNNILKIILDIKNLEKHFIYYLIDALEAI